MPNKNSQNKKNGHDVHWRPCGRALLAGFFLVLLSGCEAALELGGVDQELTKNIRRTDQFQGVAHNDSALLVVGSDGVVLVRPNGAKDWQRNQLEGEPSLVDVAVCPDQSFVALSMDKKVWFADENASTWSPSSIDTPEDVLDITCAPDNSVWVVGSFSSIWNSPDKGSSWQEKTLNEDAMLTNIQFVTADTVFVTGEFGIVVRSNDGGATWQIPQYVPNDFYIHAAKFNPDQSAWVAGLSGKIFHSNDAGETWTSSPTPIESPIYSLQEINGRLFALGDYATVLEYDGFQWQQIENLNAPVYLRDSELLADGQLLVVGGMGSLYTLDLCCDDSKL